MVTDEIGNLLLACRSVIVWLDISANFLMMLLMLKYAVNRLWMIICVILCDNDYDIKKLLARLTALLFGAITDNYSQALQACNAISCSKVT